MSDVCPFGQRPDAHRTRAALSLARGILTPMGRNEHTWASQYSQAQKEAVIRAVVVDGMSCADAARKAAAGGFKGLGKYEITGNYTGILVRRAKAHHSPEKLADPQEAARATATAQSRMHAWVLRAVDEWERNAKAGRFDWPEHDRLMRALAQHTKGARTGASTEPEQDENPGETTQTGTQDVIARLLEAAQTHKSNGAEKGTDPASSAQQREVSDPAT